MKLNFFNAETLPKIMGGGMKHPRVSLNKAGTISFNQAAMDIMKLKAGDKITFAQDEESPADWYFFKDEKGFELRCGYDKKGALFNHALLVKTFNECFELDDDETRGFKISTEPTLMPKDKSKTEYWLVLHGFDVVVEEDTKEEMFEHEKERA